VRQLFVTPRDVGVQKQLLPTHIGGEPKL
jgi:hypothetical protein